MWVIDQAEEHHGQDHKPAEGHGVSKGGLPLCLVLPTAGRASVAQKEEREAGICPTITSST